MSIPGDAAMNFPHSVYRCFDAEGNLLYVGCARDVEGRMFHHLHSCNRGKEPNGTLRRLHTRTETVEYPTRLDARRAERQAITDGAPLLNRQHNPQRFRKVAGGSYQPVAPVHPVTAESHQRWLELHEQRSAS